jgi:uncharacterized protein YwgA
MGNSIESEIISTAHHLKSLITMYVLLEFSTPLAPYYSDLCNKLEKLANIIEWERNKQNDRKRETDCKKSENNIDTDFQDTLNAIKDNKKKVETVNQKLSEYMKTLKDFYGKISIKTLKDNYDDSFEISFYTNEIDDNIISTLEKYKDYEVYDVRCEQYCSLPPIDCRIIILDNRKVKPW